MSSTVDTGEGGMIARPSTAESLMARLADGDADALGALYDELGGAVFGLARRMLRDPQGAEQVTRDVFVEIWRRAPTRRSPGVAVHPWVAAIVCRCCVAVLRGDARSVLGE